MKNKLTFKDINKFADSFEINKSYIFSTDGKLKKKEIVNKGAGKVIAKNRHFMIVKFEHYTESFKYIDFITKNMIAKEM